MSSVVVGLNMLLLLMFLLAPQAALANGKCEAKSRYEASPIVYNYQASSAATNSALYHVTLGGLFPLHEKEKHCSRILAVKNYNGFQRLEAVIFALDYVNKQVSLGKRKVALDGHMMDTCSNGVSSIASTMQMMEGVGKSTTIAGVIGASYSSVSTQVSQVLQAFNRSMLSYASTAISLSDRTVHPLFARLLPADDEQTKVVYDLVKQELNWQKVDVLTTKGADYSKSLLKEFKDLDTEGFICKEHSFDPSNDTNVDTILNEIMSSSIDGFIAFTTADTKQKLIEAVARRQAKNLPVRRLRLVGTDSWDISDPKGTSLFLDDQSFVVLPDSRKGQNLIYNQSLGEHFKELSPEKDGGRNPWIREVWADMFNCTSRDRQCNRKTQNWTIDTKVDFAFEAVMVYSDALETCFGEHGRDCYDIINRTSQFYTDYLVRTEYEDNNDNRLEFDCGNRKGMYAVYKMDTNAKVYQKIATWYEDRPLGQKFAFSNHSLVHKMEKNDCRKQCAPEQFRNYTSDCCYDCSILPSRSRKIEKGFAKCDDGDWPNMTTFESCYTLSRETMRSADFWPAFAIFIAALGLAIAVFSLVFSLKNFNQSAIKNSGRDLGAVLLVGVIICHVNTFLVFMTKPSVASCVTIRFTMTVGFTLMLSALLLKTNRIYRIFAAKLDPTSRPRCADPRSQVALSLTLTAVQIIIVFIWLALEPAEAHSVFPEMRHVTVCKLQTKTLLVAQLYNIVLCTVCTFYSFLTRNVQENFNESKWINIAMYSVCFAWVIDALVWGFRVDLAETDDHASYVPERTWAVSTIACSATATIVICLLFGHRFLKVVRDKKAPRRDSAFDRPQFLPMSRSNSSTADTDGPSNEPSL